MHEVIQKVIETEGEARRTVAAARNEADRIVSEAQQQAQELVARAREAARTEAAKILLSADEAHVLEKQQRLARIAADIETEVQLDDLTRQRAIAAILDCVCGQGQPTRELLP